MISIIHYISAKRRLKESNKTVMMMGGEEECQPMLLAQRDMIELEMKYYREEVDNLIMWACLSGVVVLGCVMLYAFWHHMVYGTWNLL
jgi:hypothetical protein